MNETPVEILLVEDDPNDVELTLHALARNKLTNHIHVARNGAEALDFLFRNGHYENRPLSETPRLVLLDLKLPLVDGIEVLRQIKGSDETKRIPVVVLTSSREGPDVEECYRLGANSYIVKPVDFEQFTEAVRQLGFYWILLNEPLRP